MSEIELVQTCGACPEQYDAYRGGRKVGYLRLRHGHFTVRLHDSSGPLIFQATPMGDGLFAEDERDEYLAAAKDALATALLRDSIPEIPSLDTEPDMQPLPGGWHVKTLPDGRCVDVMRQLYNWRLVVGPAGHDPRDSYEHGWCYFGHGKDPHTGRPRSMGTAFNAAMIAALTWNGRGAPPGFDKEAF